MIAHRIKKILENEKYECSEPLPDRSTDDFIVFLDNDNLERERILEISCRPHQFHIPGLNVKHEENYYNVHFLMPLPFAVQELSAVQVASLLLFINHNMEWPGFTFDELNNTVSFRYVWVIKESAVDPTLLLNIVTTILLNLELFSDIIEQVAQGRSTFNEILQQVTNLNSEFRK